MHVGYDSDLQIFTYIKFIEESGSEIEVGKVTFSTEIFKYVTPYRLVGIYSKTHLHPEKKPSLERLTFLLNVCSGEDEEPEINDYLLHRYYGIGNTTTINSPDNPNYLSPEKIQAAKDKQVIEKWMSNERIPLKTETKLEFGVPGIIAVSVIGLVIVCVLFVVGCAYFRTE